MRLVFIILLAVFLSSCGGYRWLDKHREEAIRYLDIQNDSVITVEIEKIDTVFKIEPDTSVFRGLMWIDELNNIQMEELEKERLALKNERASVRASVKDNVLEIECVCDTAAIRFGYTNEVRKEEVFKVIEKEVFVPVKEKRSTFGLIQVIGFWTFIAFLLGVIVRKIKKYAK